MTRAQQILMENPSTEFESAFCRATGVFDSEMECNPQKTYAVAEIQELFSYLFDLRRCKNDETPAAGTAGESR